MTVLAGMSITAITAEQSKMYSEKLHIKCIKCKQHPVIEGTICPLCELEHEELLYDLVGVGE